MRYLGGCRLVSVGKIGLGSPVPSGLDLPQVRFDGGVYEKVM